MVFEDKFEYVHSNEKNIPENSSLALANTGTEETEGLVGVGLNQMCQQDFRWFTQLVGDKTRTQRVKISVER